MILGKMGESRQTLLFSATLPGQLAEFARAGLKDPQLIRLDTETKISPDLSLAFFTVKAVRSSFSIHWFPTSSLLPKS